MTEPVYLNQNMWDEAKRKGIDLTGYRLIEPIPGKPLPEIKFDELPVIGNQFLDWDTLTPDEQRRANDLFLLDLLEQGFQRGEQAQAKIHGPLQTRAERRRARRRG